MAIVDRERELIRLRTKQALDQKWERVGEWRPSGSNQKKAEAGLVGAQVARELTGENENSRRTSALISMLRTSDQAYPENAQQLNLAGLKTTCGFEFRTMQVRLHRRQAMLYQTFSS